MQTTGTRPIGTLSNAQMPPRTKSTPQTTSNVSNPNAMYFLVACLPSMMIPTPMRPTPQPKCESNAMPIQMKNKLHENTSNLCAVMCLPSVLITGWVAMICSAGLLASPTEGTQQCFSESNCLVASGGVRLNS